MDTQLPEYLSLTEQYACYRPVVETTLDEGVEMVDSAIRFCHLNDIGGILVDITGLTGFPSPSTAERFYFIQKWAATAGGKVTISMVALPEMIDPDKIGITMGRNRGLTADVFTSESDAIAWLLSACKG